MSINIYEDREKTFDNNGLAILNNYTRCDITYSINGLWELNLECPIRVKKSEYLQKDRILKVNTPSGLQLFRIRRIEKDLTTIYCYCTHIFFDLSDNFIRDINIVGKTRGEAIKYVLDNTMTPHNFKYVGADGNIQNTARIVRYTPVNAIIGEEDNSIFKRWSGGELKINNFEISSSDRLGRETNILIKYSKNLTGITETLDMTEVATRIVPQGADELLLPEYYIDSPKINNYYQPFIRHMEFSDIKVVEQATDDSPVVTVDEAREQLRNVVKKLYEDSKVDTPFYNYKIEFMDLSDTEEYKQFKQLYKLDIGDSVVVRHKDLNIDINARIISYDYDGVLNRYNSIELGEVKKDFTTTINQTVEQVKFETKNIVLGVKNDITKVNAELKIQDSKISAVVEDGGGGMGWQLKKDAFVVACKGASDTNVEINKDGLTVNNGKFKLKNNGDTVFSVSKRGVCQANGGFEVEDGDTSCKIDETGIELTGGNGNTAKIEVLDDGQYSGTYIRDDLYVEDVLRVMGRFRVDSEDIKINGKSLKKYILDIVDQNT